MKCFNREPEQRLSFITFICCRKLTASSSHFTKNFCHILSTRKYTSDGTTDGKQIPRWRYTHAFLRSCFGGAPETGPVSNPLLLSRSASAAHLSLSRSLRFFPFYSPSSRFSFQSLFSLLSSHPLVFPHTVFFLGLLTGQH